MKGEEKEHINFSFRSLNKYDVTFPADKRGKIILH